MRLTEEQLVRFKTDGYLLLQNLLDPDLLASARERVWKFAPEGMTRDDPTSWCGPFTEAQVAGSRKGFHGLYENCRSGYIWKDRQAGATADILRLVEQVMPVAEQLLGKGQVQPPTGQNMGEFLAPDDASDVDTLARIGNESDVGVRQLFARYLHCYAQGRQGGDPYDGYQPGPPFNERFTLNDHGEMICGEDLPSIMVAGTRARGIYTTLPHEPADPWDRREPGPIEETGKGGAASGGGHCDSLPSHLGMIAFIDDVPPNGGGTQLWCATQSMSVYAPVLEKLRACV